MPIYKYEARDENGRYINGSLEVENPAVMARQLSEKGFYITNIEKKERKKDISEYLHLFNRVRIEDLAIFSQQFAVMINTGLTLLDSLDILKDQTDHIKLKETIPAIKKDIEQGLTLSEAMSQYSNVFPPLYYQLVKAGERAGKLDEVLIKLSNHYKKRNNITQKIKSALYYPLTILVISILVILFLVTQIIPQFVSIYSSLGAQLVLPTRILLAASNYLKQYWWLIILVIILLIFIIFKLINTKKGRYSLDKLLLQLPVLGKTMRKIYLSRFASTLSILLESGIDILSSLKIVSKVVGNQVYRKIINNSIIQVKEGISLSQPLSSQVEFPKMVVQMIKVGEEVGTLEKMLANIASYYEEEVENSLKGLVSLIEPIMIVLLSLIVGFIVISVVLPMFDMYSYF